MRAKKTLILGAMPQGASAFTHLAAGPWCFAGQEKLFPDWEKSFIFAPEPFAEHPELLAPAAKAAQYLCVNTIPLMAAELDKKWQHAPVIYWQTLLCPWLIDVAKQIVERALRCRAMLEKWSDEELIVPVLPAERAFNFTTEHDFTLRGALGAAFNHWLFSILLARNWPEKWEKVELAPDEEPMPEPIQERFAERIKKLIKSAHLRLPFPRLKGMSLAQALRYSKALRNPCQQADHSLNLEDYAREWPAEIPCQVETLAIFQACLPKSIKKLSHPHHVTQEGRPKLRVASVLAYEDAAYRQGLSVWRAKGNRLAYAQHGGNYGQVKVACDTELVEYSQDAFFTWGWRKHGISRGNFIPLPYPQLAGIADKWNGHTGNMLFVGTEMATFPYRLDSRPTPLQFLEYRRAKAEFFGNLAESMQAATLYRPYFDLPGTLEDAAWLLPRFPRLELCKGPLLPHLLNCRLLALDHHGTTMLEALAANTPMILYWNPNHWALTPECAALLKMFGDLGVWHNNPKTAAQKAREVWIDPKDWWNGPEIQQARQAWLQNQARCDSRDMDRQWLQTLKSL